MSSQDVRKKDRIVQLARSLSLVDLDDTGVVPRFIDELRSVVGADRAVVYCWEPVGEAARIEWAHGSHFLTERARHDLEDFERRGVSWGAYDRLRPDPRERNRVFQLKPLLARVGAEWPVLQCYRHWGIGGHDQLRVLVCEGDSLLGYLGAWQPEPFRREQVQTVRALVKPLQRRLRVERALAGASRLRDALDAALGALGCEAFLTNEKGAIVEANALGRAALVADSATTRREVLDCSRGRPAPRCERFLLRGRSRPSGALVLRRLREGDRISRAAARWGLTPAQARVLALLGEGLSNRAIAARLEVTERTVEAHLTAIMEKAQVESRAELLVRALD